MDRPYAGPIGVNLNSTSGPAYGGFLPTQLSGCVLWLRADMGITTVDAAVASPDDLSTASWQKFSSTTPAADTLRDTLDGGPTYHYCQQSVAGLEINHEATLTLEIAAGTKTRLQANLSGSHGAIFDAGTGTVVWTSDTATIVAIGGGWFRCTLTAVPPTSLVQLLLVSGASANYQGDGTGTMRIRAVEVTQRNVSAWADQSGAGNDVSQGTAANQPLWVSPGRVDFVGARPDKLTGALGIDNQPVTLLLRARTTNVALSQYVTDGSALNQRVVRFRGASDVGLYAGADLFGGAVANNTWAIVGGVFDGASSVLVVNSTRVSGNAGAAAANNLTLGVGGNGTSNPLTGSISDAIAYSRALTSDEINQVVAYLTARP